MATKVYAKARNQAQVDANQDKRPRWLFQWENKWWVAGTKPDNRDAELIEPEAT